MRRAVYAGTFDPPTNGHLWMMRRGAELFDELIIAVSTLPGKKPMFTTEERVEMLSFFCRNHDLPHNIRVESFENDFLVDFATQKGAEYILRGIRNEADFRFEHTIRQVNLDIGPDVRSVFLMPPRDLCEVSSSLVKGLMGLKGWREIVEKYVPWDVAERMERKLGG